MILKITTNEPISEQWSIITQLVPDGAANPSTQPSAEPSVSWDKTLAIDVFFVFPPFLLSLFFIFLFEFVLCAVVIMCE